MKRLRARTATLVLALAALAAPPTAAGAEPLPRVRVGVIVDGPWSGNRTLLDATRSELLALTQGEFDVRFPESGYRTGDWTLDAARENLQQLLEDPEIDLVITWGILSSHAACCFGSYPKPVVAPTVVDRLVQRLPYRDGASGVPNLSYVAFPRTLAEELSLFRRVLPFRRVAVLANGELLAGIPDLAFSDVSQAADAGFEIELIPTGSSAEEILEAIPADADAVYVWPQFQLTDEGFARLVDGFAERRLPSFSSLGSEELIAGMLATATEDDLLFRLARRTALNVQRILLGEDAGSLPVSFPGHPPPGDQPRDRPPHRGVADLGLADRGRGPAPRARGAPRAHPRRHHAGGDRHQPRPPGPGASGPRRSPGRRRRPLRAPAPAPGLGHRELDRQRPAPRPPSGPRRSAPPAPGSPWISSSGPTPRARQRGDPAVPPGGPRARARGAAPGHRARRRGGVPQPAARRDPDPGAAQQPAGHPVEPRARRDPPRRRAPRARRRSSAGRARSPPTARA